MAGVAVAEALRELTGADARTKWPNDILIGGRKVGGVLVQAALPEHAVIGIGVNVLGDRECLPADFREGATTLLSETGQAWPREDSLAAVLNQLDTYYGLWLSGASGGIVARQRELEVTIGQVLCVLTPQGQHQGQVLDIADSGGLVVSTPDGPRELLVGEVTSVRPSSPEP
jgi:BirA family biotin operon repressor/biotin-[acetyl-CoA-carboxylase] ligase